MPKVKARNAAPETGFIAVGGHSVAFSVSRSRKRKRTIAFRMERDASVRVLAPISTSLAYLTKFLQSRSPWIAQKLSERQKAAPQNDFIDGAIFSYLGHRCVIRVTRGGDAPQSCSLSPHVLNVHVPDAMLSGENLRQEVRLEIMLWMKKRARILFKRRLDLWAGRMGVSYKKFILSDPAHRWGSCSADNVIRLNWRLVMTPLPILDYVVAHELAHVRHKDHGPRFWNFVAQAMPDWQARRKRLRSIERKLVPST